MEGINGGKACERDKRTILDFELIERDDTQFCLEETKYDRKIRNM